MIYDLAQRICVCPASVACEDSASPGDGETNGPLVVIVVEFFDCWSVCSSIDSNISGAGCTDAAIEIGIKTRAVLCCCQASKAGDREKTGELHPHREIAVKNSMTLENVNRGRPTSQIGLNRDAANEVDEIMLRGGTPEHMSYCCS